MHLAQGGFAAGQPETGQHGLWQALGDRAAHLFEQVEDGFALPAGGQPRAAQRLVDGGNAPYFEEARFGVVGGVRQQLELGLNHLQVLG